MIPILIRVLRKPWSNMPARVQLALTLILIYLSALKQYPTFSSVYILITSLGFTIFFDLLFTFIRRRVLFLPLSAIVSGLIITLVVDPHALWYQIAAIGVLSMASKNFLRVGGKHIFNPAAFGLLLGISWWGVSFQPVLLLLLAGLVSVWRMRRFGSTTSFLLVYSAFSKSALFLDPTTVFFSLVMLPEPMTSPFDLKKQIIYGAVVAACALILSYFPIFPDVLIPALLLGNIFNFFK